MRLLRHASLFIAISVAAVCALFGGGCRTAPSAAPAQVEHPTLRLYVVSTLAGAIEPCGCVKDMLGGVDHAAALIDAGADASSRLLVGAGPFLFSEPSVTKDARTQQLFKAEAIAESLGRMKLRAWAPGANDWALGTNELVRLREATGARLLAANLHGPGSAGAEATEIVEAGGVPVGLAGVSVPSDHGKAPDGVEIGDARAALTRARDDLGARGARLLVALITTERAQALRLAEAVPGFQVVVVGKPFDEGDSNDAPSPPVLIGKSLVVEAPNHLQALAVIDVFVKGSSFELQDGSGIERATRKTSVEHRIHELESRISEWEKARVSEADLRARRADLEASRRELAELNRSEAPPTGSYFRYSLVEVREKLGSDPGITALLDRYYRRVNDHNRVALAQRMPPALEPGASGYVGVERCAVCHVSQRAFWLTTGHAGGYATLERQNKQYNLDCVGCHVTGYEKPGGSSVTHVDGLKAVQCEDCHGPGSRHADDPSAKNLITRLPSERLCASECHHPPHVKEDWDVKQAWTKIVGPGHGK